MKKMLTIAVVAMAMAAFLTPELVYGRGAIGAGFTRENAEGGVTRGKMRAVKGPNGAAARGRTVTTDGKGNGSVASGGAFRTKGAAGARTGKTTFDNGSVHHESGAAAAGQKGSITTKGSFNKDSQGNASGERSTSVHTDKGSYEGETTVEKSNGSTEASHTGKCYDASGAETPCPKR